MTTIYQLMSGNKQIGEICYDFRDAINSAEQISREKNVPVELWEAEDVEDVPVDCLEWHPLGYAVNRKEMEIDNAVNRKEMEIDNEIKVIDNMCDDCGSRNDCAISQAVFKILKSLKGSEKYNGVKEAVVSFWVDCCPQTNSEDE